MKPKIAIISLTYNRPEYIKRSFESLRKRAGLEFDHYVFDDASNERTRRLLKSQRRYFKSLFFRKRHVGIAKNFYWGLKRIPRIYDFYLKFDSDIEVLSDNLLTQLIEVSDFPNIGCISPRVEGVFAFEKFPNDIEFYKGHVIRLRTSVAFGCCMLFPKEVIENYREPKQITIGDKQFGIDTRLYDFALKMKGRLMIVEDLSVYQIDNMFGQRKNWKYFRKRRRWKNIDDRYVDFLRLSKEIAPFFIRHHDLNRLFSKTLGYNRLLKRAKKFLERKKELGSKIPEEVLEIRQTEKAKLQKRVQAWRIISPLNFPSDPHIEHGTSIIVFELPEWTKNNPRVVLEKIELFEESSEFICEFCKRTFSSLRALKIHKGRVHSTE